MHYTVHDMPGGPVREVVQPEDIRARIDELSGRSIGGYILTSAIPSNRRRNGRESAYVAGSKGRKGFIVAVVR